MIKWSLDNSHTEVSFSVKHMGIMNVRGSFTKVEGTVTTDDNHSIQSVNATIHVPSIATRDKDRDAHLLAEDFFHAEKYPTITFNSTKVTKKSDSTFFVEGNLTLHGTSRLVVLEVGIAKAIADPFGFTRIALEASTSVNRQDFGMKWNQVLDTGGLLVGNDVKITIDSEIVTK